LPVRTLDGPAAALRLGQGGCGAGRLPPGGRRGRQGACFTLRWRPWRVLL